MSIDPVIRPMNIDDWIQFNIHDTRIFPDDPLTEEWFKSRIGEGKENTSQLSGYCL